jgi:hypothetical protein
MDAKKKTTILIVVALVLATIAIVVNLVDSEEVPTNPTELQINAGAGEVGIQVFPSIVEDKLAEGANS